MAAARDIGGGVSAAMIGALQMGSGALGALAVGLLPTGTAWPLAGTMAGCSILMLLAFRAATDHDHDA